MVAIEAGAGDEGRGVLVERIAAGVQGAGHHVHALHPQAGFEADRPLNRDRVGRGNLFAGKAGQVAGGDGVDAVERGDVVPAQHRGVGDAGRPVRTAVGRGLRLHHRPALLLLCRVRLAAGCGAGVHLRVVQAENPPEGPLQIVAHHRQQAGVGGAPAVEHDDGVGHGRIRVDVVHPHEDVVIFATDRVAGAGAEDGVDHRAIGVVDYPHREAGCRGSHVGRRGDHAHLVKLLVGHGEIRAAHHDVRADHLTQRPLVGQRHPGRGNRAPQGRRRVHHGRRLLVGDRAVQRALIDVIIQLPVGPMRWLAHHAGVEVARSGHELRPSGQRQGRRQQGEQGQEPGCHAAQGTEAEVEHRRRSTLRQPVRLAISCEKLYAEAGRP